MHIDRLLEIKSKKDKGIKDKSIIVIGDIMLDMYMYGEVKKISPEAPVPVININNEKVTLGGAANVANNIAKLGGRVYLAGVVGNDLEKDVVISLLEESMINYEGIVTSNRPTTKKTRIISQNQQIIRIDQEINNEIEIGLVNQLINWVKDLSKDQIDCVILSDYKKGVCTDELCKSIIAICNEHNIPVLVDPKGASWEKYSGAFLVTPNVKELSEVAKKDLTNNDNDIMLYGYEALKDYNIKNLLITRSEKGMTLVNKSDITNIPTEAKEVYDVSGAGDTVISTLTFLIANDFEISEAVRISNKSAGIAVSHFGTYAVSLEEIISEIQDEQLKMNTKIVDLDTLVKIVAKHNEQDKKVVFTNGCFDILHTGHTRYLNEARKLGDILIVGLNSDESVKRLKGESRPINHQNDRGELLAALSFVDYVCIFDEDTPENLIREVKPDILVKGGDYKIEDIVGREYAKEVRTINFVQGYSTTNIINKIGDKNEK